MEFPNEEAFLPDDYEVPKDEKFLKFKEPETKFRFLSSPVLGWVGWNSEKKPVRKRDRKEFRRGEVIEDAKNKIRHFWAAPVWNYKANRVQLLEITQSSIQGKIKNYAKDPDWGSPVAYDLKVIKKGDGMDTEYDVIALPKRDAGATIEDHWREAQKAGFNLAAIFGIQGDPFGDGHGAPPEDDSDIPFGNDR